MPQLSIAWSDGPATRHTHREAERLGIEEVDAGGCDECPNNQGEEKLPELVIADAASEPIVESAPQPAEDPEPAAVAEPEPEPVESPSLDVSAEAEVSEADAIRAHLSANPDATNKQVIAAMKESGISVTSSQVSRYRAQLNG